MDSVSSIESITLIIVGSRRIEMLRAVGSLERDLGLQSGLPHTIRSSRRILGSDNASRRVSGS